MMPADAVEDFGRFVTVFQVLAELDVIGFVVLFPVLFSPE